MGPSPDWFTTLVLKPWWVLKMVAAFTPWLYWTRQSASKPRITKFFQDLRSSPPPIPTTEQLKVGVAGFCWGGYYTIYLARDEPHTRVSSPGSNETSPLVDCGFTAHPSLLSVPKDIEGVRLPLSVGNGPDDAMLGRKKMALFKKILEEKDDGGKGVKHEVVLYDGATHGFAIRGDPNDPKQAELGQRAEDQAVNWFRNQLH
jgi:dienelactone hydrolase